MEFKIKIKKRLYIMTAYAIIGMVLCVLGYTGTVENDYVIAWGTALFVCGLVKIVQYILLMRNPEKMQNIEIAEKDERNVMLWEKARSFAFTVYIMAAGIAAVVLFLLNLEFAGKMIAYNICGFVAIYWVCYLIVKRKY